MHLVYATAFLPSSHPETGRALADRTVAAALRRTGAKVTMLGFGWPGSAPDDAEATVSLGEIDGTARDASIVRDLRRLGASLTEGTPSGSAELRVVGEADVEAALDRLRPFDGVVLSGIELAGAFEPVFAKHPTILIAREACGVSAREKAARGVGIVEKTVLARDAGKVEALERRLCERARAIVCFSQEDSEALVLAGDDRAFVAPLSMPDPPAAEGLRFPAFDVGMLGQWTDPGERDRLEWFLQRVVSKMHRHMMIAVAGRLPKRFPTRDKRVFFLGEVDDRTEFLRQCRVVALPERSRTGVSLAAVEAFELGLPAVATEEALRGIDETPVNVRRVDGANTFAKAVEEMALEQRTGGLEDCDGTAFRAGRMARLDAVLAEALASLPAG